MKTPFLLTCGLILVLAPVQKAFSQTLFYNNGTNPVWTASDAWSTTLSGTSGYGSWVPGSTAQFNPAAATTVAVTGTSSSANIAVGGLTNANASTVTFSKAAGTADTLTFSGGQISGNFLFRDRTNVVGSFEVTSGTVNMSSGGVALTGTSSVSGGLLDISRHERMGLTSNFRTTGGELHFRFNVSTAMGNLTVDGGRVVIGRPTGSELTSASFTSLQGTSGTLTTRDNNASTANTLIINQNSNTEYAGAITGSNSASRLILTKSGTGSLTLSGAITGMERTTTVSAGTLVINSGNTSFGDTVGSTAIAVGSGATLAGTGTISTLAGDNVVLADGAKLTAGLDGTAGATTFALGAGGALDLAAAAAQSGWLSFDLGADTEAGSDYDQILLTAGTLNIGTGVLNFDDFSFNTLAGFAPGTYYLFDTAGIFGTLGSNLTGTIDDFDATLLQSGDLLQLNVVPEPSAASVLVFGLGAFGLIRFLRRRTA